MTDLAVKSIEAQWFVENALEGEGDEAAIEWTMTWRDPKSGERRLDRGTEWFLFRDGKIAEVRAYHHGGPQEPVAATCSASTTAAAATRCWRSRRPQARVRRTVAITTSRPARFEPQR